MMKKHLYLLVVSALLALVFMPGATRGESMVVIWNGDHTDLHQCITVAGLQVDVNPANPDFNSYGILMIDGDLWGPDSLPVIRDFLADGKAVIMTGATPYYLSGDDIPSISDIIGMSSYTNVSGLIVSGEPQPWCLEISPRQVLDSLTGGSFACLTDTVGFVFWELFWQDVTSSKRFSYVFMPEIGGTFVYIAAQSNFSCGELINAVIECILNDYWGSCSVQPAWPCGDSDCSNTIDIDDVIYLINYIFNGGPPPCEGSECE